MDNYLFASPSGCYWQDQHFASAQPWTYAAPAAGLPGLNGVPPGSYPQYGYPLGPSQAYQSASSGALYSPTYEHHRVDPQKPVHLAPGYHSGYEARPYSGGPYQAQKAAMLQQKSTMYPASMQSTAYLNGMTTAMQSPFGYPSQQPLHYEVHAQPHAFGGNRPPISNHIPSLVPPGHTQLPPRTTPSSPQVPRGPPRKPKRSGHAIWVGNIPMGAPIETLKDYFARGATSDIESVFLMAKSNCAFVNYTTEKARLAAVERFNHSLFGSVRLLCRIRREPSTTREGSQASRSPMPTESTVSSATSSDENLDEASDSLAGLGISEHSEVDTPDTSPLPPQVAPIQTKPNDRYFVLKSLTKEDLQESLMKGAWETQAHNQQILHDAFRESTNVYLIFSVNKSGEYFGYARLISSPFDIPSHQNNTGSPKTPASKNLNLKKTPATTTAPRGHIIDDPSRGVLFWEAEHDAPAAGIVSSDGTRPPDLDDGGQQKSRPFQVEWLSVRRVSFQRTKGLRNAWNANKEVKVARDGTELESEVGKKVLGLFHERGERADG